MGSIPTLAISKPLKGGRKLGSSAVEQPNNNLFTFVPDTLSCTVALENGYFSDKEEASVRIRLSPFGMVWCNGSTLKTLFSLVPRAFFESEVRRWQL